MKIWAKYDKLLEVRAEFWEEYHNALQLLNHYKELCQGKEEKYQELLYKLELAEQTLKESRHLAKQGWGVERFNKALKLLHNKISIQQAVSEQVTKEVSQTDDDPYRESGSSRSSDLVIKMVRKELEFSVLDILQAADKELAEEQRKENRRIITSISFHS